MPTISMKEMLEAGVHYGHQTNHWNPRMKKYVYGARNGIYIVDLEQTVERAKKAADFIKSVAAEGKKVIFVGTKKQAKEVIAQEAQRAVHGVAAARLPDDGGVDGLEPGPAPGAGCAAGCAARAGRRH